MNEPLTQPTLMKSVTRRVGRVSLALKLTAVGALVTAAVVLVAFWALSVEARSNTRRIFADELLRHQRTLLQLQKQNVAQLISSAALITQGPAFRYVMDTYRLEANYGGGRRAEATRTVQRELEKLITRVNSDLLLVTDDRGRVFASVVRSGPAPEPGADLWRMSAVRRALDPAVLADSGELAVYHDRDVSYQVAVYPIVLNDYTIGTMLLGERLDQGLVASARAAFDGEVVITSGRTVLAGTLRGTDSTIVDALLASKVAANGGGAPLVHLNGEEHVVAPMDLGQTQNGEAVSLWLMQPVDRTVRGLTQPLLADFVMYGALAVLAAAIAAGLAARSVLTPFKRFLVYMRTGAGDEVRRRTFDARGVPVEVGDLNDSFNQLMDAIDKKRVELEQRTTELASTNSWLLDEVRERKRVEHALRESEEQLRQSQKLEAIGTLAGGIAHDFNNLLTAISGFTQLAIMSGDPSSPATADLRHVIEAADRAAHLTKQLLAFSRKQVLQPTVLDLGDVVRGVAPLLGRLLGEQIILRIHTDEGLPRVLADRGQLEQVIMNLAVNARDAMPNGGVVAIGAMRMRTSMSSSDDHPRRVRLTISDNGAGIPENIRERVFEPFFTTKEPGKGTGLGLSTVYGIVKQSGGTIDVKSEVGKGTTFTIVLPASSEADVPGVVAKPDNRLPRGSETILLVEDDADVRAFAQRTLEERGYTVLPAGDAMEALRMAKRQRVHVLLTDIVLPKKLNGPELAKAMSTVRPAPVIIFMSGYADDALLSAGMTEGAAFLRKPFSPTTLLRTLRDALDAAKGRAHAHATV